jgi:hypothetical protein
MKDKSTTGEGPPKAASSKQAEARAARLEAELRANLKKRKEQARTRAGSPSAPPLPSEGDER